MDLGVVTELVLRRCGAAGRVAFSVDREEHDARRGEPT